MTTQELLEQLEKAQKANAEALKANAELLNETKQKLSENEELSNTLRK